MLSGATEHEDFVGHRGVIYPGDLQWMTAGRGIVHCEMPHGKEVSKACYQLLSNHMPLISMMTLVTCGVSLSGFPWPTVVGQPKGS